MARQRTHKPYRKRRGRFGLLYKVLSVALVAAAVIAACVVFFRVNTIEVVGNSRYTASEIIEASGIQMGDNLILLPKGRVASSIRSELTYVEGVSIQWLLPDGVVLSVTERVAAASVQGPEGRWLISSGGKLLEQTARAEGVPVVTGLTALNPYAGADIQVSENQENTLSYVLELLTALEERGMLGQCEALDCTGASEMVLTYDIYRLRLPRDGDYRYMLRLLEGALGSKELPRGVPGTFDFTAGGDRVYFSRESAAPEPEEGQDGSNEPPQEPAQEPGGGAE